MIYMSTLCLILTLTLLSIFLHLPPVLLPPSLPPSFPPSLTHPHPTPPTSQIRCADDFIVTDNSKLNRLLFLSLLSKIHPLCLHLHSAYDKPTTRKINLPLNSSHSHIFFTAQVCLGWGGVEEEREDREGGKRK